jgi:superfamily I DNA and/or RNA helicase
MEILSGLNQAQQCAVTEALGCADVFLIHGPPGTGKTTTAAALAYAAIRDGQRVLLCAASNTGADELTRALQKLGEDPIRVGHPGRVDESVHPSLLMERIQQNERHRLATHLLRQVENLRNRSGRSRRNAPDARRDRDERRHQWRQMLADARRLFAQAEQEVLGRARALCSTLTVAGGEELASQVFDVLIIDEASQATLPLSLIPLHLVERVVLVGDHCQLPPTVISPRAERGGLSRTAFDLLRETAPQRMLVEQHRMHEAIMAFPSLANYDGHLVAHPRVAQRTLASVLGREMPFWLARPFLFVDTAGTGFIDEQLPNLPSHLNRGEARICHRLVRLLMGAGLHPAEIGVIAPYRAQVRAISELLETESALGLEVDSVDAFQGREKEALLLSLTRSNDNGDMGFVRDHRRLNVALTRARSVLFVVGDSATIGRTAHGALLVEHAQQTGAYESAWELPGLMDDA